MIGGSSRWRSVSNVPISSPSGTPTASASASPIANSDRLTAASCSSVPLCTTSTAAAITSLGRLVKNGSTRPRRGAASQATRKTATDAVETASRLSTRFYLAAQQAPDPAAVVHERRRIGEVDRPRPRQIDGDRRDDAAGTAAHHDDGVAEQDRFVDAVRDEQRRLLVL